MTPQTPAELLDWLAENQFLEPEQVAELRAALPGLADVRALARELLQRDWLSAYQVNQILQGKGEQLLLGPYRLRERLAEGAMGQVFKAWQPRLGRLLAIKTLHKGLVSSPKARDRFLREVRLAGQLDHPNIVRAVDADEIDGRLYLAMPFLEGTNLSAILKQQGALPVTTAVDYARQVALGLQHAYERGVIHRDIKPSNLMVIAGDEPPVIKILDFGLARFEDEEEDGGRRLTAVGKLLGTIDYIAPEQAADARRADSRADIYSLGCTLYYLLTATPPFPGDDLVTKVLARQEGEPPDVREKCPEVPPELSAVLCKMMARRPDDRYQTPAEVAAALEPFTSRSAVPQALPIATSVPMALPVGAIPLAQPVAASAVRADVPMATFVPSNSATATAEALPEVADAAFMLEPSPRPAAAAPKPAAVPGRLPNRWVLIGGAVVMLLVLVLGIVFWPRSEPAARKKGYWHPDAAVHLELVRLVVDVLHTDDVFKNIAIKIRREKFEGPVDVFVDESTLPKGFSATPLPIEAKKKDGYIRLAVPTNAEPGNYDLKVVAVAENLRDETILPIVVAGRQRK
jgi:serine/threonine-protein kinase